MKKQTKIMIAVVIGVFIIIAVILFSFYPSEEVDLNINETNIKKKTIELSKAQEMLIEEIIMREDPEVLEKTSFFVAEIIPEKPNQLKLYYIASSSIPESPHATIIIDLEKEEIISIDRSWWGTSDPICCFGITFSNEYLAEEAGYMDCPEGECEEPPTDEDKENWICPKIKRGNCMPAIMPEMTPYCNTLYGEWITKNCNISFSY